MSAHKAEKNGLNVFLYLYTPEICLKEKKIFYPGQEIVIEMAKDRIQLEDDLKFSVKRLAAGWQVEGKEVSGENYFFLTNKKKEQVLLILSEEKAETVACGRIAMINGCEVKAGTDFHSSVFYEYATFVEKEALCLFRQKDSYLLRIPAADKERKLPGVYVNGQACYGEVLLQKGDKIEMFGLSLLLLPDLLLCTSFYGTMRMAQRQWVPEKKQTSGIAPAWENPVEEMVIEDSELYKEELELEPPQAKKRETDGPLALALGPSVTMILPTLLMTYLIGNTAGGIPYYAATLAMTVASAFFSVFWGCMNHCYKKHISKKEEKIRRKTYRDYLQNMEMYLQRCFSGNRSMMLEQYPHYGSLLGERDGKSKILWNRGSDRKDLWFVRLGLGEIPFQVHVKLPKKSRDFLKDPLMEEACEMAEKYRTLPQVPVGISVEGTNSIGFTGEEIYPVLLQALVQLAAGHASERLRLIYFYHEEYCKEKEIADCLKWLPHVWDEGRKVRFLAGNEKEAGEILPLLSGEHESPKRMKERFSIFIIANPELIKGEGLYRMLVEKKEEKDFCVIYVASKREQIPGECNCLIWKEKHEIRQYLQGTLKKQKVIWEECSVKQADTYMRKLAGKSKIKMTEAGIWERVSFLDLYGCSCIRELNCPMRWQENQTKDRIRVPIGKGEDARLLFLDIHEKFHGPHGLVAGTTGAGKSELLQTYLLSLAVSFSPEDVNFFIIDYKGGGMGDTLQRLPHCSGVVSNLSGRQIKRALLSIKSENTRRQRMLSRAKVSHIGEYTELYKEGKVKEPMTHLLLVVDEFAELKREEPEFMQEIISVSQVGRSLGVHLILATQKPAGTVDDKIWSNTRFRLCLRVSDKQDSMDMLRRPEAAFLTGAGRGYLQVGNNELFIQFQTGYSKETYQADKKVRESTILLTNTGKKLTAEKKEDYKMPTQLNATVEYICKTADDLGYEHARTLWMPELSEKIVLTKDRQSGEKKICLGIYDDPEQQRQEMLYYHPFTDGHLCLCGGPATGKSTFLQTFLWQLCINNSPDEVQFLLAASDCAGVNCYEQMPHCLGNMKTSENSESFFYHLERFFKKRKEFLGGISFSQFQKRQSKKLPLLFLVIDNYGSFRRITGDGYASFIEKIAAEGINYGIYLVITALGIGAGEIPVKLFEKIKTAVALEMSDRVLYADVLRQYQIGVLPKENCKGRGLCRMENRILELQTLLIDDGDDYERMEKIVGKSEALVIGNKKTEKFPCIPQKTDYEILWEQFVNEGKEDDKVPIGYDRKTGRISTISLKNFPFVITGGPKSGKRTLLGQIITGYVRQGVEAVLYDPKSEMRGYLKEGVKILSTKQELQKWYEAYRDKKSSEGGKILLTLCHLEDLPEEIFSIGKMPPFVAISHAGEEMQIMHCHMYEQMVKKQYGICLGGSAGNQRLLSFDDLNYEQMSRGKAPGYGYLKRGAGMGTEHIIITRDRKEEE